GRRPHGRGDAWGAAAATRDPVPAARRAAPVFAGLPRHAATASGHAVGGRHLPAASRPLRGSLATVGCRVDRELTPHILKRMADRHFTEVDIRQMLEDASSLRPDVEEGRWIIASRHHRRAWEIIVEP